MGPTDDGHLLVVSQRAGSTDVDEVTAAVDVLGAELAQCTQPSDLDTALDRLDGRTLVVATLDNLNKGSSGQAIQNANLMLGLPETEGLMLAPVFP